MANENEARAREMAREDIHHRLSTSTGLARLHKRDTMTVRTEDIFALLEWRWELAADRDAARREAYQEAEGVARSYCEYANAGCVACEVGAAVCGQCAIADDLHRRTTTEGK